MPTQEQEADTCKQCGAGLAPDLRYCVHCYFPVGTAASRAHIELTRKTATTHRPDPTLVFSPEKHAAIKRRARNRKRTIIAAAIAVVAVIAVSVTVSVIDRNRREVQRTMAREEAARRELGALAAALDRFKADVERYPTNEEGLRCLARKPAAFVDGVDGRSSYWYGPYLENVPEVDPWGNDYVYHTADGGRTFELSSAGPGGEMSADRQFRVVSPVSTSEPASPR